MRNFIYIVTHSSPKRGYNRSIRVLEMVENKPFYIGDNDRITTEAYRGYRAEAAIIIAKETGLEMKDGYNLADTAINIFEV